MGVFVNSTVVTLNSTEYTLAGYSDGEIPTYSDKPRTILTSISKQTTTFSNTSKPTTTYTEEE